MYGIGFMKFVPLYKMLTSSNKKVLSAIKLYDNEGGEEIPLAVYLLSSHVQTKIVSPQDFEKLTVWTEKITSWESNGFFNNQVDEIWKFVHPSDLPRAGDSLCGLWCTQIRRSN